MDRKVHGFRLWGGRGEEGRRLDKGIGSIDVNLFALWKEFCLCIDVMVSGS